MIVSGGWYRHRGRRNSAMYWYWMLDHRMRSTVCPDTIDPRVASCDLCIKSETSDAHRGDDRFLSERSTRQTPSKVRHSFPNEGWSDRVDSASNFSFVSLRLEMESVGRRASGFGVERAARCSVLCLPPKLRPPRMMVIEADGFFIVFNKYLSVLMQWSQ